MSCAIVAAPTAYTQVAGGYPQVIRPTDPQQVHDLLLAQSLARGGGGVARWVQLALFDAATFLVRRRRFRRSSADNAAKNRKGRLVVAGGLVVDQRGRVLLLHRSTPELTQWETPGGKIDRGEAPRATAIRELGEELGVSTTVLEDLGWHDFESGEIQMRYALYQMRIDEGEPRPVESDRFDDVRFLAWSQVLAMRDELSPNVKKLADLYCEGRLRLARSE